MSVFRTLVILLLTLSFSESQDVSAFVTRVIDGDTIEVEVAGVSEKVRYIGINTPELNDRREPVRRAAREATAANAELVAKRTVRLQFDVERRDRYGRLLAYVWVDDSMVNEILVRQGYAEPYTYPPNVKYAERFREAARTARGRRETSEDPEPPPRVIAERAGDYVGRIIVACGTVVDSRYLRSGRRPTFLNLGKPYPSQDMTVVIWGDDRSRFSEAPEVAYLGKEICIRGTVELYRGRPQIIVTETSDIWLSPTRDP